MSTSLRIYCFVLFALLASVFAFNRWLDVSGLTTTAEVRQLAREQTPDELLVWENLFDQRAWVKSRIEQRACPDLLILGSSTVGAFRSEWFQGRRVLNAWLGGPTVEDFEAMTAILTRAHCAPHDVILGVDHWLLNAVVEDRRWVTVAPDYLAYQAQHGGAARSIEIAQRYWDLFKERLTFVTTYESLSRLYTLRSHGAWPSRPKLVHATPEALCSTISSETYIRSADGHYTICDSFASPDDKVATLAEHYVSGNYHHIKDWAGVDAERLRRIAVLLGVLHASGSRVTLLAQPFHPAAYAALSNDPGIHDKLRVLDEELTSLAHSLGGRYLDLRDPARAGCASTEFEDGHHGKPSCAMKVAATWALADGVPSPAKTW